MIASSGTSLSFVSVTLDAAQPLPHEPVQFSEGYAVAVLEVLEPTVQCPVHIFDDGLHAPRAHTSGLLPDCFFELVQALLTRPACATLEVIAQKIKAALLARVHNARLGGVQAQACSFHPYAQLLEH